MGHSAGDSVAAVADDDDDDDAVVAAAADDDDAVDAAAVQCLVYEVMNAVAIIFYADVKGMTPYFYARLWQQNQGQENGTPVLGSSSCSRSSLMI